MTDGQGLTERGDPAATGLSAKEVARATEIARRFDPRPCHAILQFGVAPEKRMSDLVTPFLARVRMTNAVPHGDIRTTDMSLIVEELKQARQVLLADISRLDMLHEETVTCYREMLVYVRAGEIKLGELRAELGVLEGHAANESGLTVAREARTSDDLVSALERRLHDLKLAAMIALETALQTRLVRSSGQAVMDTIQNSLKRARASGAMPADSTSSPGCPR